MPTGAATATSGTRRITSPSICAWSSAPLRSASSRSPGAGTDGMDDFWHARTIPAVLRKLLDGADSKEGARQLDELPAALRRARQLFALDLVNFIDEGWLLALTQSPRSPCTATVATAGTARARSSTDHPGSARQRLHAATTGKAEVAAIALCSGNDAYPRETRRALVNCPQRPPRPQDPGSCARTTPRSRTMKQINVAWGPKRHGTDLRGLDRECLPGQAEAL